MNKRLAEVDRMEDADYWQGSHSDYPVEDWRYEVENGDTRLGYWEWVRSQITSEGLPEETG